ncbi:MAG: hypothetical protein ACLRRQ_12220 [Lachnospira pectinoschiza]
MVILSAGSVGHPAELASPWNPIRKRKKEIEYKQSLGTFVVPECTKVKELIKEYVRIYGHGNGSVVAIALMKTGRKRMRSLWMNAFYNKEISIRR